MGTVPWTVYAPTRQKEHWTLPASLDWKTVQLKVRRLQERIASRRPWMAGDDCETGPKDAEHNAVKLKKYRKVQSLQWLLTHSFHAKLLAVKRVTSNKGKNTSGVDGVVLKTSRQKMDTVKHLHRRGYKASPLRRVYIPKKSGKLRPLGIPTMHDRAMQALYALALKPIAETLGNPYSYGFREGRSCADALRHCFDRFCQTTSPEWILEADIAGCFDNISHKWVLENIPVDKKILGQWLNAGFLDKGELFPTLKGTPIRWSFFVVKKQPDGTKEYRDLIKAGWTHIVRHVKIQTDSNPYDPAWKEYFLNRKNKKLYSNKDGRFIEETGWLHDA